MLVADHVQTARDFLDAAEREFDAGDELQGSEKLWGAASHAVMAAAIRRGWNSGSHRALKEAVNRLAVEFNDESLRLRFGVAEKFHINFYHGAMEQFEIDDDRPVVREFVERLLSLESVNGQGS